jgi:hypothetical protein
VRYGAGLGDIEYEAKVAEGEAEKQKSIAQKCISQSYLGKKNSTLAPSPQKKKQNFRQWTADAINAPPAAETRCSIPCSPLAKK